MNFSISSDAQLAVHSVGFKGAYNGLTFLKWISD